MNIKEQNRTYEWHKNALAVLAAGGELLPAPDAPQPGWYKAPAETGDRLEPVAIKAKDGRLSLHYEDADFGTLVSGDADVIALTWRQCWSAPVSEVEYREACAGHVVWPTVADQAPSANEVAGIGHNSAATGELDIHTRCADGLAELKRDASKILDKHAQLRNEDDANHTSVIFELAKRLADEAEEARVAEKSPHDKKAQAVQKKWKPVCDPLNGIVEKLKALLTEYLNWREAEDLRAAEERRREEQARLQAEADEVARKAAERRAQRAREDGESEEEIAAAATPDAVIIELPPVEVAKAEVGGLIAPNASKLKPGWVAEVEDFDRALMALKNHPKIIAVVQELADAAARSKAKLPIDGVKFVNKRKI